MGKDQIRQESTCSDQMEARIVALMSSWKRRTRRSEAPSIFFVKSKGSPQMRGTFHRPGERAACAASAAAGHPLSLREPPERPPDPLPARYSNVVRKAKNV